MRKRKMADAEVTWDNSATAYSVSARQKLYDQIEKLNDDAYKSLVDLLRQRGFPTGD